MNKKRQEQEEGDDGGDDDWALESKQSEDSSPAVADTLHTQAADVEEWKDGEEDGLIEAIKLSVQQMIMGNLRMSQAHTLLVTYLENILKHPKQLKYRQIRLSNEKFRKVWAARGTKELLAAVGFKEQTDSIELPTLSEERKKLLRVALAELKGMQDYSFWVD